MTSFSLAVRGGWTAVCKDSQEEFRPITIEESRLAEDREMNIPSIVRLNHFGFFPCSQLSIREEITLLIYLDPLDCIDEKVFKVS